MHEGEEKCREFWLGNLKERITLKTQELMWDNILRDLQEIDGLYVFEDKDNVLLDLALLG
jgi:hypothetical protein